MQNRSVRIDIETHAHLKRLAAQLNTSVGRTISLAVRALRQDLIGKPLHEPLTLEEKKWLDASFE
jgi:hypothetical protein